MGIFARGSSVLSLPLAVGNVGVRVPTVTIVSGSPPVLCVVPLSLYGSVQSFLSSFRGIAVYGGVDSICLWEVNSGSSYAAILDISGLLYLSAY